MAQSQDQDTEQHQLWQDSCRETILKGDKCIGSGWHWSFGILRRPELDNDTDKSGVYYNGHCYELPDGLLFYTKRYDHKLICYINQWLDAETGEKYITVDPRSTAWIVRKYGSPTVMPKVQ